VHRVGGIPRFSTVSRSLTKNYSTDSRHEPVVSWLFRHDFITCQFYIHLRLGFPVGVFSTDFVAKISCAFQIIRLSVEIVSSFGNFCGKQIQDDRFWMPRISVGMH
jgi:hypothetical protein